MRLYTTLPGDLLGPPKTKKRGAGMDKELIVEMKGRRQRCKDHGESFVILCAECVLEKLAAARREERAKLIKEMKERCVAIAQDVAQEFGHDSYAGAVILRINALGDE